MLRLCRTAIKRSFLFRDFQLHSFSIEHSIPSFSDQLRRLYLKVHPDLLSEHHAESEVNGSSFAVLNSFIAAMKSGAQVPQMNFNLKFYVKSDEEESAKLKLVDIHVRLSNSNPLKNRREIAAVFEQLFSSCGLGSSFEWADFDAESIEQVDRQKQKWKNPSSFFYDSSIFILRKESKGQVNANSLSWFLTFMKQTQNKAYNLRVNNVELHVRSRAMIAELRVSGFRIIIEDEHDMPVSEQFDLVSRFHNAFNHHQLAETFRTSAVFMITKKTPTGVDQLGRICLNGEDFPSEWLELVQRLSIDAKFAESLKKRSTTGVTDRKEFKTLKTLEAKVASSIGIYDIFAEYAVLGTHAADYYEFLARLAASKSAFAALAEDFKEVKDITLVASMTEIIHGESDIGVILVPFKSEVSDIVEFLQEHGRNFLFDQQETKAREKSDEGVILDTKRKLRIGSLSKDLIVTNEEMHHCLRGLRALPRSFRSLFTGISLIISDRFEFSDRGLNGTLRIHWDCLREW